MTTAETIPADSAPHYLLPREAYLSEEWYRMEADRLFGKTWHLAGHVSELSEEHQRLVVRAGSSRISVERGPDGGFVASHNPWLELAGRPVAGLAPAAVQVWEDLVWVHPDPDASSLGDWVAEFAESIEGYRPSLLHFAGRSSMDGRFNWKLFVENHIDVLHLWYLHANTLPGDHPKFEWRNCGPHWVSYEPLKPNAERPPRFDRPISHVEGTRGAAGIGAHLIFPNIVLVTGRDSMTFTVVRPLAADHCVFESLHFCEPGATFTGSGEALRKRVIGSVMDEDLTACEGMQALMRSSRFAVGPLARRHEAPIMALHEALLDYLDPPGAGRRTRSD